MIPVTLITGPLGSGKTTLLRHLLQQAKQPLALVINEFGDIAVDAQVVEGRNVRLAELGGGCVCCDLRGEFEEAVKELLTLVDVERILVETTGVAEPDSLIVNVQEELDGVRLEGVVTILDADGLLQYQDWGHTLRSQIEAADLMLLNKIDLVSSADADQLKSRIQLLNATSPVVETSRCQVADELIFSLTSRARLKPPPEQHWHHLNVESFNYHPKGPLKRQCFEQFLNDIDNKVYRIKGFVEINSNSYLLNWTRGRWDLEELDRRDAVIVFIAQTGVLDRDWIASRLKECEEG